MSGLDGINSLKSALNTLSVNDTAAAQKTGATAQVSSAGGADRTSFSLAGGLVAQSADTSDVRLTKVAELRGAIASGTYSVSASAVADKMVEGMLG